MYQVARKFKRADEILMCMGYSPGKTRKEGDEEIVEHLVYGGGSVITQQVVDTAVDLVVLHCELELMRETLARDSHGLIFDALHHRSLDSSSSSHAPGLPHRGDAHPHMRPRATPIANAPAPFIADLKSSKEFKQRAHQDGPPIPPPKHQPKVSNQQAVGPSMLSNRPVMPQPNSPGRLEKSPPPTVGQPYESHVKERNVATKSPIYPSAQQQQRLVPELKVRLNEKQPHDKHPYKEPRRSHLATPQPHGRMASDSTILMSSLPPNPEDLPPPVVNRKEFEMMKASDQYRTHSSPYMPSFQDARSVYDQRPSGPQLESLLDSSPLSTMTPSPGDNCAINELWKPQPDDKPSSMVQKSDSSEDIYNSGSNSASGPGSLEAPGFPLDGIPPTQLRGGQESSRYETRSPLPVSPKPVAQYGVRRYPWRSIFDKEHGYENEEIFKDHYEKEYGQGSFAVQGEMYSKSAKPTVTLDNENDSTLMCANHDYVNNKILQDPNHRELHVPTHDWHGMSPPQLREAGPTKHGYVNFSAGNEETGQSTQHSEIELDHVSKLLDLANCELAELKDSNRELLKQLECANCELAKKTDTNIEFSKQLKTANQELTDVKAFNQQLAHTNLEQTKTNQLLSQQLETANAELAKFHTERSSSDIEPWKVACNKVEKGAEIARGGWGTISKGNVSVAIKELHGALAHQSYIDQFRREMQILSQVRHSNLVQFIGAVFDQENGAPRAIPLIIIELLDTNLRSAYEKGQLRADHKLPIFKDVAKALKYLHERYDPIIHRDVSAPNVLLEALPGGKWKGKLSDLGSANYLKNAQTHAPGAILYAAPETFPTAYNPDAPPVPQTFKLDVYSFGVMLCEVMTDRFPKKEDYGDMLRQVQRTCLPIYNLIRQCTEYKQENRPEMVVVLTTLDTVRYP